VRPLLPLLLALLATACRSPLADLKAPVAGGFQLAVPQVRVEDHSRSLKRLRDTQPSEANTPEARREALAACGSHLDAAFLDHARAAGLVVNPASPYRLALTLTSVGEVRSRYLIYGIASGVAWGVGTGLATHNVPLAVGLGGYELVEESIFWIAGSSLFGRFSAPVVLEADVFEGKAAKPLWHETYYVIWGGKRLKTYTKEARKTRTVQITASLDRALDNLFEDLAKLPTGDGLK